MAINLTGVPTAAAGDLGMVGQNPGLLSDPDILKKKKALMGAAMGDQMQSATQFLTGSGTAFTPISVRSALGLPY